MYWCRDGQMVSKVLLQSTLALKLPDLTHQLCYSIAFLRKNNLSRSLCLSSKAGPDCTGLLWAAGQLWKLPVLQLCAAMQQGALQHSRAAGTPLGTDRTPRACVLTPWEMAWMQLNNRNSEMHCSGCNASENQAVSQVFVLAFLLECHGKNPCGCVTEISPLSPQRGTWSEDLLLRSWAALLLLPFLFQLVLCTCLCTHSVCSAGGSESTGREEAWGGSADPTPPTLTLSVNILVVQTFLLLCVMSIQSSPLPMHRWNSSCLGSAVMCFVGVFYILNLKRADTFYCSCFSGECKHNGGSSLQTVVGK